MIAGGKLGISNPVDRSQKVHGYAHVDKGIEEGDNGFVVHGLNDDRGGDQSGDDVRLFEPTTDPSTHNNPGEEDGSEEELASVFRGCGGATSEGRLCKTRIERDVLDVLMS